jgi:hypothetical protein
MLTGMYAGSDHPPWNGAGPGMPPPPSLPPQGRLRLHLAVLLFPLTAGVLTGAAMPLLLTLDPQADWESLLMGTLAALALAAPAAHWLAARLLRRHRQGPVSMEPCRRG